MNSIKHLVSSLLAAAPLMAANHDYVWAEAEHGADKVEHANDWYDPVESNAALPADLSFAGVSFGESVYADLLTGEVYALPPPSREQAAAGPRPGLPELIPSVRRATGPRSRESTS